MRVLIVGAGIAGPTLAFWLLRSGHEVTIVESAPRLRSGGYLIDFWGAGFEVADRMGIVPRLQEVGYRITEVREVSARGRRIAHFDPRRLLDAAGGRLVSLGRSDLSAAICDTVADRVEMIFSDTVEGMEDDGHRVHVRFAGGGTREFDVVVGADGLHSRVRELAFGPEVAFDRPLGITVAAFDLDDYVPREALVAVTHTRVGSQSLRFSLRDGATMFCFTFRHDGEVPHDDVAAQHEVLRSNLGEVGWEVPSILARLSEARTFYMDRASQIRMPTWSRGRVGLIGDAAACPSLLAGQGSALAMVEAYVLASALCAMPGDPVAAFRSSESQLAAMVRAKQDAAIGLGAAFAPRNRAQLLMRNAVVGLMAIPVVADLAMGRSLRDPIALPPVWER